jgi:uncharacterized protein (DUF1330 family)
VNFEICAARGLSGSRFAPTGQRLPIKTGGSARESDVTAYLIVEHKITDPATFEEYRTKVGPVIAKHGGRYLTKGGTHRVLETTHWQPDRVAIIEFPDTSALEAWYNSPEFQPLMALRRASVDMDKDMLITIEGL